MLTVITGTPGAGKSLYAVSMIAKGVPGSTIESDGESVKRVLYSNVKNLLLEHEVITGDDLNNWHLWAKPGAVILFDEVQEVWRGRGISSKVPDCIGALETHRHMGVDIILVTQHPMLIDQNIRRLVNQHIHLRRITKKSAMVYEWDMCANPQQTRSCIASKFWMHPTWAYSLYKSAQLHTKTKARVPFVAYIGLLALAGLAYAGPMAYGRISNTFGNARSAEIANLPAPVTPGETVEFRDGLKITTSTETKTVPASEIAEGVLPEPVLELSRPVFAGCFSTPKKCTCLDASGASVVTPDDVCRNQILGGSTPGAKVERVALIEQTPDLHGHVDRFNRDFEDKSVYAFMSKSQIR